MPHDKFLRFRSSSNAEDSQELTGAGLYDSFSGCIADDTDSDTKGPSLADPNEPDEKGVLRAIEKVFASFYNENAWLERLRHQVREQDTGMAILVHHNFPDELEMANGVVTFKYVRSQWGDYQDVSYSASIVTQLGALSVTNPEGGAIAEEVNAFFGPGQSPVCLPADPLDTGPDRRDGDDVGKRLRGTHGADRPGGGRLLRTLSGQGRVYPRPGVQTDGARHADRQTGAGNPHGPLGDDQA